MIMSTEKKDKHYDTFVKCVFHDGKFNADNLKRAFDMVTEDMMLEVRDAAKTAAFISANYIAAVEVK